MDSTPVTEKVTKSWGATRVMDATALISTKSLDVAASISTTVRAFPQRTSQTTSASKTNRLSTSAATSYKNVPFSFRDRTHSVSTRARGGRSKKLSTAVSSVQTFLITQNDPGVPKLFTKASQQDATAITSTLVSKGLFEQESVSEAPAESQNDASEDDSLRTVVIVCMFV